MCSFGATEDVLERSVLVAFVPVAVALILSPGPDSVYTLTRSVSDGRAAGLAAALGTSTGIAVHTAAAVIGLSAVLRTSAAAFTAVKFVGAAYLVYLGVRTLRRPEEFEIAPDAASHTPGETYRSALAINVLNPKVAVFFLAFLPQFVRPAGSATAQIVTLGALYAGLVVVYMTSLAVFSAWARRAILGSVRVRTALRWASGTVLVGFGLKLALERRVPS
jgi:threonine/homoserine/homoserine lactone efflux protein